MKTEAFSSQRSVTVGVFVISVIFPCLPCLLPDIVESMPNTTSAIPYELHDHRAWHGRNLI